MTGWRTCRLKDTCIFGEQEPDDELIPGDSSQRGQVLCWSKKLHTYVRVV